MTREELNEQRDELKKAFNNAARKLEEFWDAERDIELIIDQDVDDLYETWISPLAVTGGDIDDESLNEFIDAVLMREAEDAEG